MWTLHTEDEHKSNFKLPNSSKNDSKKKSKNDNNGDSPSVQVDSDLLKNVKSYLAQFEGMDFQMGGTQG